MGGAVDAVGSAVGDAIGGVGGAVNSVVGQIPGVGPVLGPVAGMMIDPGYGALQAFGSSLGGQVLGNMGGGGNSGGGGAHPGQTGQPHVEPGQPTQPTQPGQVVQGVPSTNPRPNFPFMGHNPNIPRHTGYGPQPGQPGQVYAGGSPNFNEATGQYRQGDRDGRNQGIAGIGAPPAEFGSPVNGGNVTPPIKMNPPALGLPPGSIGATAINGATNQGGYNPNPITTVTPAQNAAGQYLNASGQPMGIAGIGQGWRPGQGNMGGRGRNG